MIDVRQKTALSYWFPTLERSGIPVPKTAIIHTKVDLVHLLDGVTPDGYGAFIESLLGECNRIGWPVFMRTGYTSGKHSWLRTCYIPSADDLPAHVTNLVEESEMCGLVGLPSNEWVVREMLTPMASFIAFNGFPVGREFRFFVEDGKILCHHPYWPEHAIDGHTSCENWKEELDRLNSIDESEMASLRALVLRIADAFRSDSVWSADMFFDAERQEWLCTDMAVGEHSFHWPDCPVGERLKKMDKRVV